MRGDEDLNETHVPPTTRTDGSGEEASAAASNEMEDIRDAMAEAIHEMEMEMETSQREMRGEGGDGREKEAAERENEGIRGTIRHTEQQRHQQHEQ